MDPAEALLAHPALRAFVESVVPADEHPSAWEVGAPEFLRAMLTGERRDLAEPALAALEAGSDDEALAQLADLVIQGYYGDPGNGGNRDGASWSMIGYRPRPEGTQWPRLTESAAPVTAWSDVRPHYDAVVVGAGAGGGVAACVLAEAGLRVLLVERGSWLAASALPVDHLRSQRLSLGYETRVDPPSAGHPRVVPTPGGAATTLLATDPRWGNNALTVGGGTRVYGAQAWRFCPEDFAMASTYGVPEGSSLADWPLAYDDLEADYDRAEWELGVSGDAAGDATAGPRRRGYPMPPFPHALDSARLAAGAAALGLGTTDVPLLINTTPYNGRGACIRCASCVGFACPGEFKTDTRNTVIPRAVATGRCDVLTGAQVARVLTDADGRVAGVRIVGERTLEVSADDVVLAAGAVETARLLLNSASASEPAGLGNRHDQVGRHLQSHVYAGAWGLFDEPVRDSVGPGPGIATTDHRHANPGIIGGAMLANDFVPTPLSLYYSAVGLGLVPRHGAESKRAMRELFPRLLVVMGPVQEVPSPESRVTVDPSVLDRWGLPAARLSGGVHPEDLRTADFAADRAVDWLRASGAASTYRLRHLPDAGPSRGQHQAGTCRMGLDPATSVTDRWGRVWGHDNLTIADASLHVTNGGVNPVLTVLALAYRVAGRLAEERGGVR
ncbi:NAD(P)-binding protein [Rathayibacter sp. VKM Ac-2759]|uniref:GMC oxidoreductase n=1 Tax=Rathayibacter sp. VKM Ac-2759 TaxID=2609252 RepID=UPI0013199EB8|nr:GMC oxidoreductase [Rathayibacter sp. VKM Ac-2759]QHC65397.1 NAD(P)-binding protein [Rathayibacter sp. VKM Ac-2759]